MRVDTSPELIEQLAALSHEQWSGWMRYLFGKSIARDDGATIIPRDSSERWLRQMNTPYSRLPEEEKDSDRTEAKRVLELLERVSEKKRGELLAALGVQAKSFSEQFPGYHKDDPL